MEKPLKKKCTMEKPSGKKHVHDGKAVHYNNVKVTFLASSLWHLYCQKILYGYTCKALL